MRISKAFSLVLVGLASSFQAHAEETRERTRILDALRTKAEKEKSGIDELDGPCAGQAPAESFDLNLFEQDDVVQAWRKLDGRHLPTLTELVTRYYEPTMANPSTCARPCNPCADKSNVIDFPGHSL